ncbi:MAG: hypothetical protein OEZ68_12485 [Gammaproteobacteria bacterium]|nr:hypothetical protein [Gammaproteobacteria bacterium]MDH5801613.1 hypothetical protein [Gammaproteobacteria bacterium]
MTRRLALFICMLPAFSLACGDEIRDPVNRLIGWGILSVLIILFFGPVVGLFRRSGPMPHNTKIILGLSVFTLTMAFWLLAFTRHTGFGLLVFFTGWLMPASYLFVTRKLGNQPAPAPQTDCCKPQSECI